MGSVPSDTVLAALLPHYRDLVERGPFERLSQQHQIDALRQAIEVAHPTLASAMRGWSPLQQSAILAALGRTAIERPSPTTATLWTVSRGGHTLRAVAVPLPTGLDLRLLDERGEMRRTQLCLDDWHLRQQAEAWRSKLLATGWR